MTCFCELSHDEQMMLILLLWFGCMAGIILLVYRASHRRAVVRMVLDLILHAAMLQLLTVLAATNRDISPGVHTPALLLAAGILAELLYAGCSLRYEFLRSRREINAWSIKETMDDLPVGLCFADELDRVVLCNRKMDGLSRMLIGGDPQTLSALTGALEHPPESSGVVPLPDMADCCRFPDGRIYRFRRDELTSEGLKGYVQLTAHDETEIIEGNVRLQDSNTALERVNRRLQKMYERMADDVREKESLELKVYLHDTLGRSLLTVQDVKNSSSREVRQKLKGLKEAVSMLSAGRPALPGTLEQVQQEAEQLGVRVTLTGYIPPDTAAERLIAAAVRECVTNCIRHAKGDAVYLRVTERAGLLRAEITNSGDPPKGEIVEGSGLSSLRRSVEASGGEMHLSHSPAFSMVLYLPRKEDDDL